MSEPGKGLPAKGKSSENVGAGAEASASSSTEQAPPLPLKRKLAQELSEVDENKIMAMYGHAAKPATGMPETGKDPIEIVSSQETVASQEPGSRPLAFWNNAKQCVSRITADGQEDAEMQPGPDGFALAFWPDGKSETTEHANLEVFATQVARKRPACAMPAKAKPAEAEPAHEEQTGDEPAKAEPAKACGIAWKDSKSFGFLKPTYATGKSYIQAKESAKARPYLLVNVQGCENHYNIVKELMEFAASEKGLTKENVVCMRDKLKSK